MTMLRQRSAMGSLSPKLILSIGLLTLIIMLAGCRTFSRDEVERVPSPDGQAYAVLFETNGGATTSFGYDVELWGKSNLSRTKVASVYGAVRNAHAYGVNLHWTKNDALTIEYLRAQGEPRVKDTVRMGGRVYHIALRNGVEDPTAPSGGMLFNLKRK